MQTQTKDDQTLSPEEFIQQVEVALPQSTVAEKRRLIQHARAWAVVSYPNGIPENIDNRLKNLEAK